TLDGNLCNDHDKTTGPFPPPAPADEVCFSGVGDFSLSGQRTDPVAFRVNALDTSQPGGGKNSGPSPSVFQIRIWIPTAAEITAAKGDAEAAAQKLAKEVACTGPVDNQFCTPLHSPPPTRAPDSVDG